ncbi:hypothetical protein BC936DRAFT_137582 [Jimgerdemannia flammicorona]|uniref:Uncharacterized protein n=1 Tax=Jimgerdemannia flammicorona TaxID=994334 RepID=A0A433CX08_9FUNG|nr:hypothetical protein BC936DRAFT_137582 [Jimgerdemannia flammicorona]
MTFQTYGKCGTLLGVDLENLNDIDDHQLDIGAHRGQGPGLQVTFALTSSGKERISDRRLAC